MHSVTSGGTGAEQTAMHDIEEAVEELREAEHHPREIHFTVDGEEYETTKRELTPNEIIREFGKKDPATNYLVEIKGDHKISFQGKGDEKIKMHDCMNFQIVSTGPTPVSDSCGPDAFIEGLRRLGYEAQTPARQAGSHSLQLSGRNRQPLRTDGPTWVHRAAGFSEYPAGRPTRFTTCPGDPSWQ